jgi:hypothetical protein
MLDLLDTHFAPSQVAAAGEAAQDDDDHVAHGRYSLAIVAGADGARLTHSHLVQWHFARQSLLLWRGRAAARACWRRAPLGAHLALLPFVVVVVADVVVVAWVPTPPAITHDMFRLWSLAEQDLLSTNASPYVLQHTGQGLQRVQPCPRTYRAMQVPIHACVVILDAPHTGILCSSRGLMDKGANRAVPFVWCDARQHELIF